MAAKPEPTPLGGERSASPSRPLWSSLASVVGALILGEYEFKGVMPYIAGVLFGLVLGEIAVGVGRRKGVLLGALTAAAGAGGLVWAAWISSGEGLRPLPFAVWPAAVLAAATGGRGPAG